MIRDTEAKTILNKTKRRDPFFLDDYTVNPFLACSFNCLYCYIRGSNYGEHMEQSLTVKTNAVQLLKKQLGARAKKSQYGIIVLSSATDPYLKIEKTLEVTRQMLQVILEFRFPVHIITKSDLVIRDIDLLLEIHKMAILPDDLKGRLLGGAIVSFSFSTLDEGQAKIFEPGATSPMLRLQAMAKIKEAGLPCGASLMPLMPYLSDTTEALDLLYSSIKKAKADYVIPASISLFGYGKADSKTLVLNAIRKHYPHLAHEYESLFQSGYQMPFFYKKELQRKTNALHKKYQIRNSVLVL